jgi:predicted RNase H-like HicB family nuclease
MELTAAITREGNVFVARCLEIDVTSQGESMDGALANLKEALGLYFEDESEPRDLNHPIVTTFQLTA